MACRLDGAKPVSEPMLDYWTPGNKFQGNSDQKAKIFIQENSFEQVGAWHLLYL